MESVKAPIERPRAVLLDWDGTLVDSLQSIYAAHNHTRVAMGHQAWSWDEYKNDIMQKSSRELYPKLYGDRAQEAMDILYAYYGANHLAGLLELPFAGNLLAAINLRGIPMGVVSNKKHEMLLRESTHLGWDRFFNGALIGAGAAEKDKPAPEPVSKVLAAMTVAATGGPIWYVGDTVTDMQTAQAANCNAVLVLNGENKEALISEFSPYLVVNDCRELAGFLAD